MTDILFPTWMRISSQRIDAVSNTAIASSIFTNATRSTARSGDKLKFGLTVSNANNINLAERAKLSSIFTKLRGQANRLWYSPVGYRQRGSFPSQELVANGNFLNGTTSWTASSASDTPTFTVTDGVARIKRTGTAASYKIEQTVTNAVNGATYACRTFFGAGSEASASENARVDTTNGNAVDTGYSIAVKTVSSTSVAASPWSANAGISGQHFELYWVSLSRCMLINGANQFGTMFIVDQLPISNNGLLKEGDYVQIGSQLSIVASPLNSDSSGVGYLELTTPLRNAPNDNDPIIVNTPMGKFVATDNTYGWDETPGIFANYTCTIEEDIGPSDSIVRITNDGKIRVID